MEYEILFHRYCVEGEMVLGIDIGAPGMDSLFVK
jgi:hypothetical protein